jgi:hypothetical protein
MAFENVISSWVLTHRKELNLRVTVLRWPQTLDLELHDLHVQITWEGHIYFMFYEFTFSSAHEDLFEHRWSSLDQLKVVL